MSQFRARDSCTDPETLHAVTTAAAEILTAPACRAAAAAYLRQRGIDATALPETWPLGYAPVGWTRLVDALGSRFSNQALLDAGLAHRCSRGTLVDTFRDRVIFPIHDHTGKVAGFVGRDLSGNADVPKYLNTRRTPLFDKGTLLYGLHEGRTANPGAGHVIVVEGPLDVLAIVARVRATGDIGGLLPVAVSGTAFTAAHARLIAHIAEPDRGPVVIALDGDAAGRAAALPAGERLRATGLDVRIALLPSGCDPTDYLAQAGACLDIFRGTHALPLLTARVQHAIASQGDRMQWVEGRLGAARSIAANLATYPVDYAAGQIGWISRVLDLDSATFTLELASAYRDRSVRPNRMTTTGPTPSRPGMAQVTT